jgi:hypothetical protein
MPHPFATPAAADAVPPLAAKLSVGGSPDPRYKGAMSELP